MSAPFGFRSPYIQPQPHSTPAFATDPYLLNKPRAPRAPVVNPYDKFTQEQFDQWIGGITSSLRRALGHESDEPDPRTEEPESVSAIFQDAGARRVYVGASDSEDGSEGDGVNDSLADIRIRHVTRIDKGKGRDPMEGPGLPTFGKGGKDAPIEIDLDEHHVQPDEDALDDEEVAQHLSFLQASDEEEEEESDQWQLPQSFSRTHADSEIEEEQDDALSAEEGSDNMIELLSSDEEQVLPQNVVNGDDEHERKEDEGSNDEEVDVGYVRTILDDDDDDLEEQSADEEEGSEEDEAGSDEAEEEEDYERDSPQREIITLDSEEEDQLDEEVDIVQPPDQNTAFPPHSADTQTHIEIRNPWLGPQTYAEDYYSGGPIISLPGAVPSVHHLGVNDDGGGFLTPDVVTPAESNERETSVNEELDEQASHIPHLQFVQGIVTQSEMPPETEFAGTESSPKAVQVYDFDIESEKVDHVQDEPRSSRLRFEADGQSHITKVADVEQVKDTEVELQVRSHSMSSPVFEDNEVAQQSQLIVEDCEDAARQAEDAFDRAYEEMDAEIERERESPLEVSHTQSSEQVDEAHPSPTLRNNVSITMEEVMDEEATDQESSEEDDLSSSPVVVPLGTSDLDVDVEPMSEEEPEVHSDDGCSPHKPEVEAGEFAIRVEDQLATELEEPMETSGITQLGQPLSNVATPEPSIDDDPIALNFEEPLEEPENPHADFINTAVEAEHEQQQLPTPPAEQDGFLHHSPARNPSPDVDFGQTPKTEDFGQALLTEPSSNFDHEPSETPVETNAAGIEIDGIGTEQNVEPLYTDAEVEPINPATIVTDNTELIVQDVTEDLEAIPGEWRGIVEVASKAPSAEPETLSHEQPSTDAFSKEASVISLPATDSSNISSPFPYSIEEEVTDEDADGEVDPEMGGNPDQELKDLAGEIFNEIWWASDILHKPHADAVLASEGKHVTGGNEKTESTMKYVSQGGDEDDIASSREPSPGMIHQSTRSPSPTIDPKELMRQSPESEKDLYGASEVNAGGQTRENTAEYDPSETARVRERASEEEPSPTIPGLTLTSSQLATSPIPGLGARLLEDTVLETGDGEIPGLTWSSRKSVGIPHVRSATFPQVSPTTLVHDRTSSVYPVLRRATEPVLFSDPYPYSLSTPGGGEDTEEDLEEQDMSMSSSSTSTSVDKELEKEIRETLVKTEQNVETVDEEEQSEKQTGDQLDRSHAAQETEITDTPVAGLDKEQGVAGCSGDEQQQTIKPTDDHHADPHSTPDATEQAEIAADVPIPGDVDQDRDADGDIDPDFMQIHENVVENADTVEESSKLAESISSAAPESVQVPSKSDKSSTELSELVQEPLAKPQELSTEVQAMPTTEGFVQESQDSDTTKVSENEGANEVKIAEKRFEESSQPPTIDEPKDALPAEVAPVAAAKASVELETVPSQESTVATSRKVAQNGKRKRSRSPESDKAETRKRGTKRPRVVQTMNGKSKVHRLSDDLSDEDYSSSASSLNSSNEKTPSRAIMPTPASPPQDESIEHFYPMLHKHGRGAKKQYVQEKVFSQRPLQKTPSTSSMTRSDRPHEESSSTYVSLTSRRVATSRATRSNCRYRKISVPKVEDGPRIYFLVPGCSLGDLEVVEENEIEDHGEATYADSLRMIQDIESLDFDSYLIGILRQLVGVDLLREQEVFYLPAPGEEPIRKPQLRKTGSERSSLSRKGSKSGNIDSSSVLSTPRHSVASVRSPPSVGSITTVTSRLSREQDSVSSLSSDLSDEEVTAPVKTARSKLGGKGGAPIAGASEKSGRQQLKRSRPLPNDALAYKPIPEGESSDNDKRPRIVRMRARAYPTPRSAWFVEADTREAKKLKRDR